MTNSNDQSGNIPSAPGAPSENKAEEHAVAYSHRASAGERRAFKMYIEHLLSEMPAAQQEKNRQLFRDDAARRAIFRGGKDDGTDGTINGDLGIVGGTLVWGQQAVQDTAGNVRAACILGIAEVYTYLAWLAWEGCGWYAVDILGTMLVGDFTGAGTLGDCVVAGWNIEHPMTMAG